jgi:PhzF family phenazine biosynthesis protein
MAQFAIIDAFTRTPHAGNPAAVVFVEGHAWPDSGWMTRCAAEFALSETAFVLEPDAGGLRGLRWFTPTLEVNLCGHATLGTSFALWSSGRQPLDQALEFDTKSGRLACARRQDGAVRMDFPARPVLPCDADGPTLKALGLKRAKGAASDGEYLIVEVDDETAVRALKPDFNALAALPPHGVCVTAAAQRDGLDFVSRFFGPKVGVPEDPVTGSSHCRLAPYWSAKLGLESMKAEQVSPRGGSLEVDLVGDRVFLTGHAVKVAEGSLLA